jgi:hypothetical protein
LESSSFVLDSLREPLPKARRFVDASGSFDPKRDFTAKAAKNFFGFSAPLREILSSGLAGTEGIEGMGSRRGAKAQRIIRP